MELAEARGILILLANGIDPETRTTLPSSHVLQRPEVIRAIYTVLLHASGSTSPRNVRENHPENAGQSWDQGEDQRLIEEYDAGQSVADLAAQHRRSEGAIRSRLTRLGRLEGTPDSET